MTPLERRNPDILKASRKKRIAAGAGMKVEDLNKLLKQHRQMADMMKMMGQQAGKRGPMAKMAQMFGIGGGMPTPTPEQIEEMKKQMGGGNLPAQMPKLPEAPPPGLLGGPQTGLPGLGGVKLPGLGGGFSGGFNPFGKKK